MRIFAIDKKLSDDKRKNQNPLKFNTNYLETDAKNQNHLKTAAIIGNSLRQMKQNKKNKN